MIKTKLVIKWIRQLNFSSPKISIACTYTESKFMSKNILVPIPTSYDITRYENIVFFSELLHSWLWVNSASKLWSQTTTNHKTKTLLIRYLAFFYHEICNIYKSFSHNSKDNPSETKERYFKSFAEEHILPFYCLIDEWKCLKIKL